MGDAAALISSSPTIVWFDNQGENNRTNNRNSNPSLVSYAAAIWVVMKCSSDILGHDIVSIGVATAQLGVMLQL